MEIGGTLVFVVNRIKNNFWLPWSLIIAFGCVQVDVKEAQQVSINPRTEVSLLNPAPTLNERSFSKLKNYFNELYIQGKFNGIAMFVSSDSVSRLKYGVRNYLTEDTLKWDDQFQLASLSKPFTALAILKLVEEGKLDIDQNLKYYLPDLPYEGVSIKNLLTHTSGIGNYAYVTDKLWGSPFNYMSNDDLNIMLTCAEIPIWNVPGKHFDYCNTNYAILANVVEQLSGEPFSIYMKRNIFDPLGMKQTEILNVNLKTPQQYDVQGHFPNGEVKSMCYLDGVIGDKGVYSTVGDLYKFYCGLFSGNVLSDSLLKQAISPKVSAGHNMFYGFGWRNMVMEETNDTIVYHNGWWRGFKSYFWMSSKKEKCAIILTNHVVGKYLKQEDIWPMF